jgi:methylglutaconyl-CoA hydratase
LRATFREISELPIPTITSLTSIALGGGLELALTTDLRVFASTAIVGLPETRLGIIPGAGGTFRLGQLIGKSRTQDLILTGRRISGTESLELGLCNRLVNIPKEDVPKAGVARALVLEESLRLATQICEGGPLGIRAALAAVKISTENGENTQYETVLDTHDRDEALVAFREKRKPQFTGR